MNALRTMTARTVKGKSGAWIGGVLFTVGVGILGLLADRVPGVNRIGPMACAIVIAVLFRQVCGYPEHLRPGISFVSKRLLRVAIVLYGLKLNISVLIHQGLWLLLRDVGTVLFAIIVTLAIAKVMKADQELSLLLAIGTGVCGAAAIGAVSPIVRAKEDDTALAAGMIALVGTVFAVAYCFLEPILPLSHHMYGVWSGVSLHEIAHVALAAAPAGPDALSVALLAKLGRVFLLVPLSFVLLLWKRKKDSSQFQDVRIEFPWFLIGFIISSVIGSYFIPSSSMGAHIIATFGGSLTTFLLTMAMVGLGLNVRVQDLRSRAVKPLLAMGITSILLSTCTFFTL